MQPFAMVPVAAFKDRRLSLEQLRVLGALCSFRRSRADFEVSPSRDEIARRCGIHTTNISSATTALERLGWITKHGKGGHSKASVYVINPTGTLAESATVQAPGTLAESATVQAPGTLAESATDNPSRIGNGSLLGNGSRIGYTLPLAESATRINTRREIHTHTREQAHASSKQEGKQGTTLRTFIETCKAGGEKPIPDCDPVFAYAEQIGLSHEMLAACWAEFKAAYLPTTKRQRDWRAHYRNAVRRNWYRLWYLKDGEPATWTTAGEQAKRAAA